MLPINQIKSSLWNYKHSLSGYRKKRYGEYPTGILLNTKKMWGEEEECIDHVHQDKNYKKRWGGGMSTKPFSSPITPIFLTIQGTIESMVPLADSKS